MDDCGRAAIISRNCSNPFSTMSSVWLTTHAIEGIRSPHRDFGLYENSVAIAVIQDAFVLRPVDAREDAVQMFHVGVVVCNPFSWLCHAKLWIAPGHAFHAHQAHALAIKVEGAIANLKPSHAECRRKGVFDVSIRN